ncbi:MAG: hypothetical protein IAE81_22825 [Caldilineaceae bacterium]|jgi:hypothetical protein|nr:hypothetical protein [Caldilineaceae bacterium]
MLTSLSLLERSEDRVNALVQLAAELGQRNAGGGMTRRRSTGIALRCLAAFARKQFDFLRAGLGTDGAFEADARFPLEFLIEATARQVSFDTDVLLRTLSHREAAASIQPMRDALDLADRLATNAILPAVRHGLVAPTVMMTYFQKSPTIRLMPYVPLAVIGIDFSAISDATRLLAIAHETGHHVYRQITVNYTAHLDAQIEAMAAAAPEASRWPLWLLAWEEEIFADIYAALVAGPAAALGLHQVILTGTRTALTVDDGDHPLDALRPYIMHRTLRALAAQGAAAHQPSLLAAADALDALWQEQLVARGAAGEFTPVGVEEPVSLADAQELLQGLVEEMLSGALAPLVADAQHSPWSTGSADPAATAQQSFEQFVEFCALLVDEPLPELALRSAGAVVVVTRFPVSRENVQLAVGETGDAYLDERRDAGLGGATLTAVEWKSVFLAGDWTTQEGGSGIKPPVFRPTWWLSPMPTAPVSRPLRR